MTKPTVITGTPKRIEEVVDTGAIVVTNQQLPEVKQELAGLDFGSIPSSQIITIGLPAEQALQKTLDGFLSRLDKKTASQVFALFTELQKGVEDANLPEVLARVQKGVEPNWWQRFIGMCQKKTKEDLIQSLTDEMGKLITGRTKTLADEMNGLEDNLEAEMRKLFEELKALEQLKQAYAQHFSSFTVQAAVASAFYLRAKAYVQSETASAAPNDMAALARINDLQNKLQLLQSRSLALEGVYTRLPADQLVIQQIQQAGISTLQEVATTLASRFASIKMTLLAVHGAFSVGNVQMLAQRQAQMDQQLIKVRNAATRQIATTAATAPGQNRLEQAQQIESIVKNIKETAELVKAAKQQTETNFEQARVIFAQARQDLASLNAGK